jgi:hypothetical protein
MLGWEDMLGTLRVTDSVQKQLLVARVGFPPTTDLSDPACVDLAQVRNFAVVHRLVCPR